MPWLPLRPRRRANPSRSKFLTGALNPATFDRCPIEILAARLHRRGAYVLAAADQGHGDAGVIKDGGDFAGQGTFRVDPLFLGKIFDQFLESSTKGCGWAKRSPKLLSKSPWASVQSRILPGFSAVSAFLKSSGTGAVNRWRNRAPWLCCAVGKFINRDSKRKLTRSESKVDIVISGNEFQSWIRRFSIKSAPARKKIAKFPRLCPRRRHRHIPRSPGRNSGETSPRKCCSDWPPAFRKQGRAFRQGAGKRPEKYRGKGASVRPSKMPHRSARSLLRHSACMRRTLSARTCMAQATSNTSGSGIDSRSSTPIPSALGASWESLPPQVNTNRSKDVSRNVRNFPLLGSNEASRFRSRIFSWMKLCTRSSASSGLCPLFNNQVGFQHRLVADEKLLQRGAAIGGMDIAGGSHGQGTRAFPRARRIGKGGGRFGTSQERQGPWISCQTNNLVIRVNDEAQKK